MYVIRVFEEADERVVPVEGGAVIGRDEACAIHLPDPMVARRHAAVELTPDGRVLLRDLGSRHGTYLAGRRISEAYLAHGDEILIGVYRLRFEDVATQELLPGEEPQAASAPRRLVPLSDPGFPPASTYGDDVASLKSNYERLRAAFELSRSVGIESNVGKLLDRILETAFQLLGTDRGAIVLLGNEGEELASRVIKTRSGEKAPLILSETIINEVLSTRSAVLSGDTTRDARFQRARSISAQGIRSAMCVPLVYQDEILGVMHLDSQIPNDVFGESDLDLFATVAGQAALAVKNALLLQQVRKAMVWERLDRVVQSLPEGLLLLDGERRIVLMNEPMERLLPLLSERARGEVLAELGGVPVDTIVSWRCQEVREVAIEAPVRRLMAVTGTRIGDTHSSDAEYLVLVREVTEERDREHRARHQDQLALLGQLASGIAHDFNNLLTAILNYTELLESRIVDPALREDFEQIRQAGLRATALTRQLLAFSRREAVRAQVVELNELLAGMERLLELSVGKRVLLRTRKALRRLPIEADPTKIEQVIVNLVVNARDAMPEGGMIGVETRELVLEAAEAHQVFGLPAGRYVELAVTDTGCGIAPELRERIFEPFFTTKEVGQGTGLGLAMVFGIVTQVGGAIAVDSAVGKGTVFRVVFPMLQTEASSTPDAERGRQGGITVLVVDDDDWVRRSVSRILRQRGMTAYEEGSPETALRILLEGELRVDMLITDVVMPGLSGLQLARTLRENGVDLPILFISGEIDGTTARDSVDGGAAQFLAKPFSREDLLQAVRAALADDHQEREQAASDLARDDGDH